MTDGIDPVFKYVCGILAAANAAQYARDWFRERRYNVILAEKDKALADVHTRYNADLMTMVPALTKVLDWMRA